MADLQLPFTTKRRTYAVLIGAVVAILVGGLTLPMVVGERAGSTELSSGVGDLDTSSFAGDGSGADADGSEDLETATDGTGTTLPGGASSDGAGAAGAGGSVVPGGGGGGGTGPGAPGALTASDVGVTPTSIKLGLLTPTSQDVGDPQAQSKIQTQEFQTFLDDINARGGILGRKLEIVVANYDLLDQGEGARAACLKLAEDEKVFAVFNTTGFGPPGALCLTREKGVPFLQGSGHPEELYGQANGLYSSSFDSQTRNFRNMVWSLNQLGALRGKKIGVLGTEWIGLRREQEEGIVHTLQSLGFDPFVYWLSGDPASSQSQIPIAVQQMKQNGVQLVILGADFLSGTSFAQQAEVQAYRPGYAAADPWGWSTDYVTANMPASFHGAITVTAMRTYDSRAGVAEPAVDAGCREIFEQRAGMKLDRANDPQALYVGTMLACGVVQRFERAATLAGPNLTRGGLAGAVPRLGTFAVPFSGGPGSYGPGKLDGADHYRPQSWHSDCKCWRPLVGQFTRGHY